MKVLLSFSNLVTKFSNMIDLYKTPITFKFKSTKYFHSLFGKILTYLVYISLISYIIVLVNEMVYRTNKKINNYTFINEEKEHESDFNTLNLEENPFFLTFYTINWKNVLY